MSDVEGQAEGRASTFFGASGGEAALRTHARESIVDRSRAGNALWALLTTFSALLLDSPRRIAGHPGAHPGCPAPIRLHPNFQGTVFRCSAINGRHAARTSASAAGPGQQVLGLQPGRSTLPDRQSRCDRYNPGSLRFAGFLRGLLLERLGSQVRRCERVRLPGHRGGARWNRGHTRLLRAGAPARVRVMEARPASRRQRRCPDLAARADRPGFPDPPRAVRSGCLRIRPREARRSRCETGDLSE
jgi:hypothetical protein